MRCLPAFLGLLLAAARFVSANQQQGSQSSLWGQNSGLSALPSSGGGQKWGQQQPQQPQQGSPQQPRNTGPSDSPGKPTSTKPAYNFEAPNLSFDESKRLEKETSLVTTSAQPQQLLTVQTVAAPVQQDAEKVEKKKWTPGYVSATLADAWAEVLKTKAEGKFKKEKGQEQVTIIQPQAQPLPQKSKNFSFTNIKLQTSASGELPNIDFNSRLELEKEKNKAKEFPVQPVLEQPVPPVEVSGVRPLEVAVSGPRSPFITENVGQIQPTGQLPPVTVTGPLQPTTTPFVTENVGAPGNAGNPGNGGQYEAPTTTELQAKLTELQAQLAELERLKLELIDAREDAAKESNSGGGGNNYTPPSPSPPPKSSGSPPPPQPPEEKENPFKPEYPTAVGSVKRRLLDSGMPGWDPGSLLVKQIDITASEIQALREKLGEGADGVKDSMQSTAETVGQVQEVVSEALQAKQDKLEEALDDWRNARDFAAGTVQDVIGGAMEKRANRRAERWGLDKLDRTFWR